MIKYEKQIFFRKGVWRPLADMIKRTVCLMLSALMLASLPGMRVFAGEDCAAPDPVSAGGVADEMQIIAHQGYSAIAPGNTLAAFRLSGERGFWGAECDARRTSDGVWVICHDYRINGVTTGSGCVSELTFDELRKYSVNVGNGLDRYPDERIPTLAEYLDVCRSYGMHPVIEIPIDVNTTYLQSFTEFIGAREEREDIIIISFGKVYLSYIKNALPDVSVFLIRKYVPDADIEFCAKNGIDGIDFSTFVSKERIGKIRAAGLELMVWTVDDTDQMEYYRSIGVTRITSNSIVPPARPDSDDTPHSSAPDPGDGGESAARDDGGSFSLKDWLMNLFRSIFG